MSAAEFEARVVKAIQDGSVQELKRCCIGRNDVNRPISINKEIPVKAKSGRGPFPSISSPTPIVYAILCEQDDLLQYLGTKTPHLGQRVNGWTPLHYAACTQSHKCLETLLKYEYVQQNIDAPVEEPGLPRVPSGRGTTALHIACTNRRHAAAILLTQPLPTPDFDAAGRRIEAATPDMDVQQPANALQMTAHGHMPLHIAARQNDWDMCQIILHAADDATVRNSDGKTAADIAREHQYNELAAKLERNDVESIEELRIRFLAQPVKRRRRDKRRTRADASEYDEEEETEYASAAEVRELHRGMQNLLHMVQQLVARVTAMEARRIDTVRTAVVDTCRNCSGVQAIQCAACSCYYCAACWTKPGHPCARRSG
jgi:hypothetical protein